MIQYTRSLEFTCTNEICLMVVRQLIEVLFMFTARLFHKIQGIAPWCRNWGLIPFYKLKPYFVKKVSDFNSCCKYHLEMVEINSRFNNMQATAIHHRLQNSTCKCKCFPLCANPIDGTFQHGTFSCQATTHAFERIFDLHQKRFCALRFLARNGSILIVSRVIVKVVVSIFCQFTI